MPFLLKALFGCEYDGNTTVRLKFSGFTCFQLANAGSDKGTIRLSPFLGSGMTQMRFSRSILAHFIGSLASRPGLAVWPTMSPERAAVRIMKRNAYAAISV